MGEPQRKNTWYTGKQNMACLTCAPCGAQTHIRYSGKIIERLSTVIKSALLNSAMGAALNLFYCPSETVNNLQSCPEGSNCDRLISLVRMEPLLSRYLSVPWGMLCATRIHYTTKLPTIFFSILYKTAYKRKVQAAGMNKIDTDA